LTVGILLLDKPSGLSSSGATQRVRRLLRVDKAGHVGSLDPLATGMLPICLGEATKVAGEVLEGAKTYTFRLVLGARTETGDIEGAVIESLRVPPLDEGSLRRAVAGLVGDSMQVPPMYSALKRDGQPLYRLARAGVTVERAARPIRIHSAELLGWGASWLDCRIVCAKGTYVRVLGEDLARALGTCGHLGSLRREAVEPFAASQMITLEQLKARLAAGQPLPLLAPDAAVGHLAEIRLDEEGWQRLRHGNDLVAGERLAEGQAGGILLRAYGPRGQFAGLAVTLGHGRVRAKRLLVGPEASE
jgi:tRNA pseudouridine55 synthase